MKRSAEAMGEGAAQPPPPQPPRPQPPPPQTPQPSQEDMLVAYWLLRNRWLEQEEPAKEQIRKVLLWMEGSSWVILDHT